MLQLGWKAGPEQYPPVELMNYAISADKAGFDLIDVSDHNWRHKRFVHRTLMRNFLKTRELFLA